MKSILAFLAEPLPWFTMRRWLYHFDKFAHTAGLTLVLFAVARLVHGSPTLVWASWWAAVTYFLVGKVLWFALHPQALLVGWEDELLDVVADLSLSLMVVSLALYVDGFGAWHALLPFGAYAIVVSIKKTSP